MALERFDELTDAERASLSYQARVQMWSQDDPRYRTKDPAERACVRERWQLIADSLDPTYADRARANAI